MRYSTSPDILESDDLAQVAWDAIEPIWDDLPLGGRYEGLVTFMDQLAEGQRGLIALDWCQKEIRNGGIKQLFENSTGDLVPWAITGFQMIGAERHAAILAEAAAALGSDYPTSRSARRRAFSALDDSQKDKMEALENQFIALLWSEEHDLEPFRGRYVKEHPEQFVEG